MGLKSAFRIESYFHEKWVPLPWQDTKTFCQGYLVGLKDSNATYTPKRIVRVSDNKVVETLPAREKYSGMSVPGKCNNCASGYCQRQHLPRCSECNSCCTPTDVICTKCAVGGYFNRKNY